MPQIGPLELVIILVIALVVIGPGKLPDVGSALGKSIKEFRKASTDVQDAVRVETTPLPATPPAPVAPVAAAPAPAAPVAAAPVAVGTVPAVDIGASPVPSVAADAPPVPAAFAPTVPAEPPVEVKS